MTDRQRLLALFDAAFACKCDLVIWQASEKDAPDALMAWAETRRMHVEAYAGGEMTCLEVKPAHSIGRISVYLEMSK